MTMYGDRRCNLFTCFFLIWVLLITAITPLYIEEDRPLLKESPILSSLKLGYQVVGNRLKSPVKMKWIKKPVSYVRIYPVILIILTFPTVFVTDLIVIWMKRLFLMPTKFTSTFV